MTTQTQQPESDFHVRVDHVLHTVQDALDTLDSDVDTELTTGILTATFANLSKLIINRQTPNREIWVAAKSGGFHFRQVGEQWMDTRSGEALASLLSRVVYEQSGSAISFSFD